MQISKADVDKIAALSKLTFTDDKKEKFRGQLEDIVTYVEKLNELDLEGVEPTYYVQHMQNVLREDEVRPSLSQEEALANAPAQAHGFFRVPKVIE